MRPVAALLFLALAVWPASLHGEGAAPLVDLAKTPRWRDHAIWLGRPVSSVLPVAAIARLVLLEAVTSATADVDAANIRRLLSSAGRFEAPPAAGDGPILHWRALVATVDGRTFQLVVYDGWAVLVSPEGHGYFKVPA